MSNQKQITAFFTSRKRKGTELLQRESKLLKSSPTLLKVSSFATTPIKLPNVDASFDNKVENKNEMKPPQSVGIQKTPKKEGCDIRSYMTSQSPYRPECPKISTPVKFLQIDPKRANELTPAKSPLTAPTKVKAEERPSLVKKSIRFEDDLNKPKNDSPESGGIDTDDIIKAANDLVEKIKNKNRTLSVLDKDATSAKQEIMTATQLKKKLARSAKLAELKSSLNKLGKQTSELMKLERKNNKNAEPKLTKFESIEVEVQKSPHKGALASPVKTPEKPAYQRFSHLVRRTAPGLALPLPFGHQRLLEFFNDTDTVCSLLLNRGEVITFRKLKSAVQELSRKNFTERHLAQMAAVLPSAFSFQQQKLRNFGSTSKVDRYELVVTPLLDDNVGLRGSNRPMEDGTDVVRAAERKKMTPNIMQARREAFHKALLDRTMDEHEKFLAGLEPPITVVRDQLTRWHPNFMVDLVADIPPIVLPEAPNTDKPASAKEVLERAKKLLSSNERLRNALDAASRSTNENVNNHAPVIPTTLDDETKKAIDKRVEAHNPLKGISKSLLEKIRAKQAAKALEAMKMSPADEKELLILSQLPDIARIVRTLFVDGGKCVLPMETVLEKVQFSNKRLLNKGDVDNLVRRLVLALPDWLSIFSIKTVEYLKLNRTAPFKPILDTLNSMIKEKRGH